MVKESIAKIGDLGCANKLEEQNPKEENKEAEPLTPKGRKISLRCPSDMGADLDDLGILGEDPNEDFDLLTED